MEIILKTVSIYDTNGKLLRKESIVDYTKENVQGEYASLDNFIRHWTAEEKKEKIKELLYERGIDFEMMKAEILKLDPFLKMGKPPKIASFFGGKEKYLQPVKEPENEIYRDEVV